MARLWFCLVLCVVAFGTTKDHAHAFPENYDDTYNSWYSDEAEKLGIISANKEPVDENNLNENVDDASVETNAKDEGKINDDAIPKDDSNDSEQNVEQEIALFRQQLDYLKKGINEVKEEDEDNFDPFDDYQFEDNRSDPKDEQLGVFPDLKSKIDDDTLSDDADSLKDSDDTKPKIEQILNKDIAINENDDDSIENIDDDSDKIIFKDTEDEDIFNEKDQEDNINDFEDDINMEGRWRSLQDVIEQTNKLLQESNDAFEDASTEVKGEQKDNQEETLQDQEKVDKDVIEKNNENEEKIIEPVTKLKIEETDDEDSVKKGYADLNEDLKQLFETWDKLVRDDDSKVKVDDDLSVKEYEDKYGKPFREDVVLSQRGDYENIDDDDDFAKLFKNNDDILNPELENEEIDQYDEDVSEEDVEKVLAPDDSVDEPEDNQQVLPPLPLPEYYNNSVGSAEVSSENSDSLEAIDDDKQKDKDSKQEPIAAPVIFQTEAETKSMTNKTVNVENLTPEQYLDLMNQFQVEHSDDLDTQSDNFGKFVAPVHITLSLDEPIVITSPNYPNPYPTNNIIDWIFDGEGMGIELNITDFSVNGALGDFLLVKPGGVDATGSEGLVFSYHLNEPRKYRFMDVDRMFIRFESRPGMAFRRGFQFSVKMIAPLPEELELQPDPEPVLPRPPATMTVNLGGVSLVEFLRIQEKFRQLVADMATMYINANLIDPGVNTTSQVTQITSTAICNVQWPNFESCAEVMFGVPLVDEDGVSTRLNEEDLREMWFNYIYQDPFALRLRRLGVTEFSVPNDGKVLMVWLVIAAGVVISMALLAFALWRFSCFEDYTRMPAYSDTDSVNSAKRGLDLYPTPHQTLPPLYADSDYKWADDGKFEDSTRVDMGGFANRSYVRDDLFDIDSDEDVVTPARDRNAGFSPRNMYQV